MQKLAWLFLFLAFLTGCVRQQQKKMAAANKYFDVAGLIGDQEHLLDSISPSLYKKARINDFSDEVTYSPTKSDWQRELNIFLSADLNSPPLLESYKTDTVKNGIIYSSLYPDKTSVDMMKISFSKKNVSAVEARVNEYNTLFKADRLLTLQFTTSKNPLLESFSIYGWQKLASGDSTHYAIEGEIKY